MELKCFFIATALLCLVYIPVIKGQELTGIVGSQESYTDTVHIIRGNNYLYFSKSILGISHIHFLRKGMRCINQNSFTWDGREVNQEMILQNIYGTHKVLTETSGQLEMNDIIWNNPPPFQPDSALYHVDAVIFNSYFEDMQIEVDNEEDTLFAHNIISYIPEGYAQYEVVYVRKHPFIIRKVNYDGVLYTEWFSFGTYRRRTFYTTTRYITHGIGVGLGEAAQGIGLGGKHAALGFITGGKHTAKGAGIGLEGGTSGIGRAVFNESKMFYRPIRELDNMSELVYEEKAIEVEKGITIHTYSFKSQSPKANVFLIHGNGGNVSTYKQMIQTLVSGQYNVYVVDWRGYGKSTGRPDYKGVLKDTEAAFDDFLLSTREDSLKVVVYGMSLGGQIATKLVSSRQQEVDGLILDGSLSSAQNLAIDFMPGKLLQNSMKRAATSFNQEYIAEIDIQTIVDIPKLIIHSITDQVVLFYHGERLYNNAQEPKSFWKTNTRHIRTLEELPDQTIEKIDQLIGYNDTE